LLLSVSAFIKVWGVPAAPWIKTLSPDFIIDTANKAIDSRKKFTLALSGGQTPELLYTLLASPAYSEKMPWQNTFIFWGDERCVTLEDERNNAHRAINLFLKKVNIPSENIHRIPVALSPEHAAAAYENELKDFFVKEDIRFDCILLGLGEDGHTASLLPGTDVLHESDTGVRAVFLQQQRMFRITLTAPLINQARQILFLVSGNKKAEVLKTVMTGYQPDRYPAQLIKPENGEIRWFIDFEF
jgi:6-phosphogluconolactonase